MDKTGGQAEDDKIFIVISIEQNGQDKRRAHQLRLSGLETMLERKEFGQVHKRDSGCIGRRMLKIEVPGRSKRGRPQKRFTDVVKEDMQTVVRTGEMEADVVTVKRNSTKKMNEIIPHRTVQNLITF